MKSRKSAFTVMVMLHIVFIGILEITYLFSCYSKQVKKSVDSSNIEQFMEVNISNEPNKPEEIIIVKVTKPRFLSKNDDKESKNLHKLPKQEKYVNHIQPNNKNNKNYMVNINGRKYLVNENEKIMMAKVVYAEARGESFLGQQAVACVILNRLKCADKHIKSSTIQSIIEQKGAFATIGSISLKESMKCMPAVEAALKGKDPTRRIFKNGAIYFYAPKSTSTKQLAKRSNVEKLVIGQHVFHDLLN